MFYNACKGGTDAFDAMCALTSVSRKTRRWPLCMFYTTINIAMNNAWILYKDRPHPRPDPNLQKSYNSKFSFLYEVAYRMCRPWGVQRYLEINYRHSDIMRSLHSVFKLTREERGDVRPAPARARGPEPVPEPAPVLEPALAAAAWLPHVAPLAVNNAIRSEAPNVVPVHPFYGGRWLGNSRQSCDICTRVGNRTTKDICESQRCGNKPVCKWHSVILCQRCFYNLH